MHPVKLPKFFLKFPSGEILPNLVTLPHTPTDTDKMHHIWQCVFCIKCILSKVSVRFLLWTATRFHHESNEVRFCIFTASLKETFRCILENWVFFALTMNFFNGIFQLSSLMQCNGWYIPTVLRKYFKRVILINDRARLKRTFCTMVAL